VIQGAAGAILPLAFGIVRDEFPREKISSAIGITAALLAVGGGLGIVLAGPIVDALDYHYLFWLPLVFVVLSAVAAAFFVPESEVRTPGRINPLAATLLTGTLVAMLVALSEGSTWGWGSGRTLGLFVAAILMGIGWVRVELTSASPLVDMTMMRLPAVWTTNLVALLFGMSMYAIIGFLPEFLQTPKSAGYGFAASITASGLYLLPMTITMFIAGVFTGRLVGRIGSKLVLVIGSAVTAVPMAFLAFAHSQSWEIYLASSLLGAGLGLAFSSMSTLIVESVSAVQTGVASGMNANIRTIGGSIGAAVMSTIVTAKVSASGLPRESGYTNGFAFLLVVAVLAALAAVLIPSARKRKATSTAAEVEADLAMNLLHPVDEPAGR
jgi:MFS family permease